MVIGMLRPFSFSAQPRFIGRSVELAAGGRTRMWLPPYTEAPGGRIRGHLERSRIKDPR
jgi:hypothetical protein